MPDHIDQSASDHSYQFGVVNGDVFFWNSGSAPARPDFKNYLRLLAVLPSPLLNPDGENPPAQDIWAEWRSLEDGIHAAWDEARLNGAPWALVRLNPPTRDRLIDALSAGENETAYQALHFTGSAQADGLILEDPLGRMDVIPYADLAAGLSRKAVSLLVLHAGNSVLLASRLYDDRLVPALIAVPDRFREEEGAVFFSRFYACLARGKSVSESYEEAMNALLKAFQRGDLTVPPGYTGDPQAYAESRASLPVLLGDAVMDLPDIQNRASAPLIAFSEPPRRGVDMSLVDGFVGRRMELVRIAHWLQQRASPVIAVSGLGGIGKSSLAAMTIMRQSWRFRAVVVLSARDSPHLSPGDLVPLLDGVLDLGGALISSSLEMERLDRSINVLNGESVLLVLDNLEDLSESALKAWTQFLRGLDPRRGSIALITLRPAVRHPLTDLAGQAHLALERLGEPDALKLLVDGILNRNLLDKVDPFTRITLYRRRHLETLSREINLTWLPIGIFSSLFDMAEKAGRHPLALKMALGDLSYPHVDWTRALENISDLRGLDWEAEAEKMVGRMVTDLRTARPDAFPILIAMLPFQEGASYEALKFVSVTGDESAPFDDCLKIGLDASLLEVMGINRYALHPLTRAYLTRIYPLGSPERMIFERKHAEYYADLAVSNKGNFDLLEAELSNLRIGFGFASSESTRDDNLVIRYSAGCDSMFQVRGYWNESLIWLKEAYKACEKGGISNDIALANFCNNIAGAYIDLGYFNEALDWMKKTEALDKQRGDDESLGTTYNGIAVILDYLGRYDDAFLYYTESMKLLDPIMNRESLTITWINLGAYLMARGEYEQALAYYNRAAPVLEEIGDRRTLATVHNNIGGVHIARGEYEQALAYINRAAPVLEEIGDRQMLATVHSQFGQVHRARGEYEQALAYFNRAAPVLEEIGDRHVLAKVHGNIGQVHMARGEYEQALAYFNRAAPVLEEIGNRHALATVHNNIGGVHSARGEYEQALAYYNRAAPVLEEIGDRQTLATVHSNIGQVHSARGEYEQALAYFNRAAPVLEEIGDRRTLVTVHNNIGQVHRARGEYEQALAYFNRAAPVLEEIGDRHVLATVHNNIGQVHRARGENKQALEDDLKEILKSLQKT